MKLLLSTLLLTLSLSALAQQAPVAFREGNGMGNGGHPSEMEFQTVGREIIQQLGQLQGTDSKLDEINLYDLASDVEVAAIEIKLEVIRNSNGKEVCVISNPGSKLIKLNLKCWNQVSKNKKVAQAFVLKAYLELDSKFRAKSSELTSHFFQAFKK